MDIKEIKQKRDHLAATIAKAVNAFQQETGVVVTRVEIEHLWTNDREQPRLTTVGVRIALEPE